MRSETTDIAIIGAGPAGSMAASLLADRGWKVVVLERQHFPRFSIGESLLPQSMALLDEAGLLGAVDAAGFRYKDGAMFSSTDGTFASIEFPDKSTPGPETAYQVRRAEFDAILSDQARSRGADLRFGQSVTAYEDTGPEAVLTVQSADEAWQLRARFVLDGSGFGAVLARLLDQRIPSTQPCRRSVFNHVEVDLASGGFDCDKILASVHPDDDQVWLWLIPLSDSSASVGVVGLDSTIEQSGSTPAERLAFWVDSVGWDERWLQGATVSREASEIRAFSSGIRSMYGPRHVMLGNAAEFLDPIFSSGVTVALKSASLAAPLVDRMLRGDEVDWDAEFVRPLAVGVEAFRACVDGWYSGRLQRIIFSGRQGANEVSRNLTGILAGYAWDTDNPMVRRTGRYLELVDQMIHRAP